MRQPQLEAAVVQYLRSRGFVDEAEKIAASTYRISICLIEFLVMVWIVSNPGIGTSVLAPQEMAKSLEANDNMINHLLFYSKEDDIPSRNEFCYAEFTKWLAGVLDFYKADLTQLLYPLFVHLYIDLVMNDHSEEAKKFLQRHRHEHLEQHREEISILNTSPSMASAERNEVFIRYRENRVHLIMSSICLELLLQFLHAHRLTVVLRLLNEYFIITPTAVAVPYSNTLTSPEGMMNSEMETINGQALPRHFEDIVRGQPAYKNEELLPAMLQEMKNRESSLKIASYNTSTLPSACMYTLLNSLSSLTCSVFSDNMQSLAVGGEHAPLRVWRLTQLSPKSSTLDPDSPKSEEDASISLSAHAGAVYGLSFLPDHRHLLSGGEDGTCRLWDVNAGSCVVSYKAHNFPVWSVSASPYGYHFLSTSHDRTARVWTTDRLTPVRFLAGHFSDVNCVVWHPSASYAATGSSDKTCRLWDIESGKTVRLFADHENPISAVAISPNGQQLATGDESGMVKTWDIGSGRLISSKQVHDEWSTCYSLAFSTDNQILAAGYAGCALALYSAVTQTEEPLRTLKTKKTPVHNVQFSQRNILVCSGPFEAN